MQANETTSVVRGFGMHIKSSLAILGLCLFALAGTAAAAPTGAALCVTCHDEEDLPDMSKTAHGFAADSRAPNCTTCHGDSLKHTKKPGANKPDRMFIRELALPAAERSDVCLTCHNKDAKRALWGGSQHSNADIACNSCHKIHGNNDKALSRAMQNDLCFTCHKEQRTQVNKPSHHPLPEGKMVCTDCHNPHGSVGPKLVKRDSTNATCYTCHAEKRGPFVHQHDPVAEDCSNCHNPHGSVIGSMLKSRPPLLCQQCHTPHVAGAVGAVGVSNATALSGKNVANLWQGRSCLNCHTQIHGSNNPSTTNLTPQLKMR